MPDGEDLEELRRIAARGKEAADQVNEILASNAGAIRAANDILARSANASKEMAEFLGASAKAAAEIEAIQKALGFAKDSGIYKILADLPVYKAPSYEYLTAVSALPPSPEEQAVERLADVHSEIKGLARLMVESGRQTEAMVETTKANLTALQTVISELRTSRNSADFAAKVLIWLTVAIFLTGAIVALAGAPQIGNEITTVRGWLGL